ncbi:MAG: hypothetical protein UIC64_10140 [Agathobacter sp.]|nr:hypothetical protein [Agathobacter sp.]
MSKFEKKKMMKLFGFLAFGIFTFMLIVNPDMVVLAEITKAPGAAGTDVTAITSKIDILFSLIAAVFNGFGLIFLLWGIFEWGIAYCSGQGGMEAQSFKRIAGGLVILVSPDLVTLFT